jgi:hypothetical protein
VEGSFRVDHPNPSIPVRPSSVIAATGSNIRSAREHDIRWRLITSREGAQIA